MTSPDPPTWEQAGGHVEWLRQRAEHHDRCSDAAVGADGAVYHAGYARELSACAAEIERLRAAVKSAWTMTEAAQMNGERPGWVDAEELRHVLSGATDV